jgi:ABC-type multidrug transport system permease subunit
MQKKATGDCSTVHFPIAFVTSMFLLSVLRIVGVVAEHSIFVGMIRAIVLILPVVAIFATLAGIKNLFISTLAQCHHHCC